MQDGGVRRLEALDVQHEAPLGTASPDADVPRASAVPLANGPGRDQPEGRGGRPAALVGVLALVVAVGAAVVLSPDPGGPEPPAAAPAVPAAGPPAPARGHDAPEADRPPSLAPPAWLPEGFRWRGESAGPRRADLSTWMVAAPGEDPRASMLLLQGAAAVERLPTPVGASLQVAVHGRPATLRTVDGRRDLRWQDVRGAWRLVADAGTGGPSDADLLRVATATTDPRPLPTGDAQAPVPGLGPVGARRVPEVETSFAGYLPPGGAVRAWDVEGTGVVLRVTPGEEPSTPSRFDVATQEFAVGPTTAVLADRRLRSRPREVRWSAAGWSFVVTVDTPDPGAGGAGLTDEDLRELARSVPLTRSRPRP